jgi:hypothetical protein
MSHENESRPNSERFDRAAVGRGQSIRRRSVRQGIYATIAVAIVLWATSGAHAATRITILVDAFGKPSALRPDWGFAALVEHDGLRILFDTGNDADVLAHNARVLGVDLTRLDFVVISHRHGDHTDGLHHLLHVNPGVQIYAPNDEYFGGPTPPVFFREAAPSLPPHMRYFGGRVPDVVPHGSPWRRARIERVATVLAAAEPEIVRLAAVLREDWNVAAIAPGHCTGERAFQVLQAAFGEGSMYAGLGSVLAWR